MNVDTCFVDEYTDEEFKKWKKALRDTLKNKGKWGKIIEQGYYEPDECLLCEASNDYCSDCPIAMVQDNYMHHCCSFDDDLYHDNEQTLNEFFTMLGLLYDEFFAGRR